MKRVVPVKISVIYEAPVTEDEWAMPKRAFLRLVEERVADRVVEPLVERRASLARSYDVIARKDLALPEKWVPVEITLWHGEEVNEEDWSLPVAQRRSLIEDRVVDRVVVPILRRSRFGPYYAVRVMLKDAKRRRR